jgi:hypothetical protein
MKKAITDFYNVKKNGHHVREKAVLCNGGFTVNPANFHHLFTYVMKALCEHCEYYQADILADVDTIRKMIANPADIDGIETKFIGIRKNGVDGNAYMEIKLNDPATYGANPYDAVFMFEINGNGDGFTGANLTMYEMEKSR